MRARTHLLLDAVILTGYLVATNPVATGTPVHEWLSVGVALLAFVHLLAHWEWTMHALRRIFGRLSAASRVNFVVDVALFCAFVAAALSGLMVSRAFLAPLGHTVAESSLWHAVHAEASTALLALVGLHLGLHGAWLVSALRRHVVVPLQGAHTGSAEPHTRRQAWHGSGSGVRGAARLATRSVWILIAVGVVATAVWTAVPTTRDHLTWLALPGGTEVAGAQASGGAAVTTGPDQAGSAAASGFRGTTAQRAAVRVSHSLVILGLAIACGVAGRELLRA